MLDAEKIAFRDRVVALAKEIAPQYGLDWRLMAAAAILESGWGESTLACQANNLFGITAGKDTPAQAVYVLRTPDGPTRFRKYATQEEGFHAYGSLVGKSSIYAAARRESSQAALRRMVENMAPVYCPDDPLYSTKILQIVEMLEAA